MIADDDDFEDMLEETNNKSGGSKREAQLDSVGMEQSNRGRNQTHSIEGNDLDDSNQNGKGSTIKNATNFSRTGPEEIKLRTESDNIMCKVQSDDSNRTKSVNLKVGEDDTKSTHTAKTGRPLSTGKRNRVGPTSDEGNNKGKKRCKIKCAKNYRQIAAEKTRAGLRQAVKVTKTIAVEALPEPLQEFMDDDKQEDEIERVKENVEKKETKKCRIKTSKTYKQLIQEKSKKAAKFAARKVHATAMQRLDGYIPDPVMQKMNEKLAERGVISPLSQFSSPDISRSPSPYMAKSVKISKVKVTQRVVRAKRSTVSETKKGVETAAESEPEVHVEDDMDIKMEDDIDYDDYERVEQKGDEIEGRENVGKENHESDERVTEVVLKEEQENEANHLKEDINSKQRSRSKAVPSKRNVNKKQRSERRNYRKKEEKKVAIGGSGNEKSGVTDMINEASKCTSVSGIAKTVAPKLAQGILNNKRVKKVWGSNSQSKSNCFCCKCCSKCCNHCDSIVKVFLSVISIAVASYDVAMAWTAFAGYYRFEGSSPLTIVFGVVCSIASILLLFEVRNAIMSCLVTVVKVKRLQKTEQGSSFRQKVIAEEYWVEIVQLLELVLGDMPIVIILALTISFASCGLYNATFKKGIVGKLALYAVFISALWKAIMACVQFCLSKPFKRNEQGKRRLGWALFRLLRPLIALAVLFFALYIILTINGVYINLTGRDEARSECDATEE